MTKIKVQNPEQTYMWSYSVLVFHDRWVILLKRILRVGMTTDPDDGDDEDEELSAACRPLIYFPRFHSRFNSAPYSKVVRYHKQNKKIV